MRIHVLSDVHLEFQRWRRNWDIASIDCDAHVLAGDIGVGMMGLEFALGRFTKPVVYACGNHEFYCRRTVTEWWRYARKKVAGTHVHLLENETVVIDGTRFLGTTLWVDFSLFGHDQQEQMGKHCAARMNDFSRITLARRNVARAALDLIESRHSLGTRLTWRTVAQWHRVARDFLDRELPRSGDWDRTVVVTHHAPSIRGIEDPAVPDRLDSGYAANLDHLIPLTDYWIHGHVHRADDYTGNRGGRVICNARGYADTGYDSVDGFQWNRVVSL
jgi:predicted phosphodiesterase